MILTVTLNQNFLTKTSLYHLYKISIWSQVGERQNCFHFKKNCD